MSPSHHSWHSGVGAIALLIFPSCTNSCARFPSVCLCIEGPGPSSILIRHPSLACQQNKRTQSRSFISALLCQMTLAALKRDPELFRDNATLSINKTRSRQAIFTALYRNAVPKGMALTKHHDRISTRSRQRAVWNYAARISHAACKMGFDKTLNLTFLL